ncbi:hypothetical protein B0T26DRAFT_745576 [Lasiosphaeria miniovina]|uniref:Kinesin light chain n=1 Tax=Lasiosphaeria miniovina TaxID=1954250 RepID=A0AA40BG32_9PEZI|nr:uncharacterized protein B0T26DRAFT_745576 [Lasiosphaeria miniovina]KAK0733541.1 hypothetical protein B0T26DRAFT_745576 [Lasiosphaeria miniovina]
MAKYEEAEQMHQQALELREKVLGREHPSTLSSMNNLGLVLKSQGKYEEAGQIHRQELSLSEKVLGREHPSTLTSMNNLALVLGSQGKYEEAEQMHRQELSLSEKVLGREHPSTWTTGPVRFVAGKLSHRQVASKRRVQSYTCAASEASSTKSGAGALKARIILRVNSSSSRFARLADVVRYKGANT